MYLTGAVPPIARPFLDSGRLGFITTPNIGNRRSASWVWAADSGCFNAATYKGDDVYMRWLEGQEHQNRCLFATAPDVVGDHTATLARSAPFLPRIQGLGYRAAFVAQDGSTVGTVPWPNFDVLFIGGTDRFKLGEADPLILHAQAIGMPVHVGRVNSGRRYRRFASMGVNSADGTFLAFGPEVLLPRLIGWLDRHDRQPGMFSVAAGSLS